MMMMMVMMMRLQIEAAALKGVMSGGKPTKVIVIGITDGVNRTEVQTIASPPTTDTVFFVPDFPTLGSTELQLEVQTCSYGR